MTQKCNLNCTYCGATVEPEIMPVNLDYSLLDLQSFLGKLSDAPVIAFYGGEPTVNWQKIIEVMDYIPAKAFMLQTNGTLLHKLPPTYIQNFHTILVSIDGRPQVTDSKRGDGVHQRAIRGAQLARNQGFTGDLIARMTVTNESDIYEEVKYLVNHQEPVFDHVHWQLDVLWDSYYEENKDEIRLWLLSRYNSGISKLVKYWVESMEQDGVILGIVPFLGITHTLLTGEAVGLRCGAGNDFFSVTTDGRVTICPILPSVSFATVGDIFNADPIDLSCKISLDEPCISCNIRSVCGGRCIYTNKTKYWGDEGFDLVCLTVKHLVDKLVEYLPRIGEFLRKSSYTIDDFDYPKVPNGVEIIP